jgi:hypothetical protein
VTDACNITNHHPHSNDGRPQDTAPPTSTYHLPDNTCNQLQQTGRSDRSCHLLTLLGTQNSKLPPARLGLQPVPTYVNSFRVVISSHKILRQKERNVALHNHNIIRYCFARKCIDSVCVCVCVCVGDKLQGTESYLRSRFFKNILNTILSNKLVFKIISSHRISDQSFVRISYYSHACYMIRPACRSWSGRNKIWWRVHMMKLVIM